MGPAGLNFADYENMKQFQGGICVNTYLSPEEKALLKGAKVSSEQGKWDPQLNYIFTNPKGQPRGCVAISWNKETWENDNKWKGTIRYEWLFTMGPETLISYGFYSTEQDKSGTGIKWRTIYVNREKNTSAALLWDGGEKPKKPKFSSAFNPDFDQICKQTHECVGDSKEKNEGEAKWTWEDKVGGGDKFSDWSTNFSDAFQSLQSRLVFNSSTSKFFDQLVGKKGIWTRR